MAPDDIAQWVEFRLENHAPSTTLVINGIDIVHGKLYDGVDKGADPIDPKTIIGTEIAYNKNYSVYSCGKKSEPAGTEGTLDIKEKESGERVTKIWWSCPYWSPTNDWTLKDTSGDWIVQLTGGSKQGGAIGTVTVKFVKIAK